MKKNSIVIILIIVSLAIVALIGGCKITIWNIGTSQINSDETFLLSSQSPDKKYTLEAYKTEPGATVDFSIKVYVVNENKKDLIYDSYHEYDVEIVWIDNSIVSINGKKLNLLKKETYDWRMN